MLVKILLIIRSEWTYLKVKNVELTEPAHIKLDWKNSGISFKIEAVAENMAAELLQ